MKIAKLSENRYRKPLFCFCFLKVTLLITDGRQTNIPNPSERNQFQVSTTMKNRGITITALGIGAADPIELWQIVSTPEYAIFVPSFGELQQKTADLSEVLCPSKLCS